MLGMEQQSLLSLERDYSQRYEISSPQIDYFYEIVNSGYQESKEGPSAISNRCHCGLQTT